MASTDTAAESVAELSPEQAAACERLIYGSLALTLDIRKGALSEEQRQELHSLLQPVLEGPQPDFALSVACWLRDRREIGNRLLPIHILVECARHEAGRLGVRTAAPKILLLPSDLSQAFGICREIGDGSLPSCLKKAGKDLLEGMSAFHAAKYDTSNKNKILRGKVRRCDNELRLLQNNDAGKGMKGKGKGKGKGKKKVRPLTEAQKEHRSSQINKRRDEALAKLKRLKAGDLKTLIRICHPEKNHELLMQMLRKHYPLSETQFALSGLTGDFNRDRAHEILRLQPPATWERQCSKFGNVPTTWRDLLVPQVYTEAEVRPVKVQEGDDDDDDDEWILADSGKMKPPEVGMTALLRNLRNILQMGFAPGFLAKHVFLRIASGGGQPAAVLAQTLQQVKKDFTPERLQEMAAEAKSHKTNIISFRRMQQKLGPGDARPDAGKRPQGKDKGKGEFMGKKGKGKGSSSTAQDLVEEFLGMTLMNAFQLAMVGSVYLRHDLQTIRGGAEVVEHKRNVPFHPPDEELMKRLEAAFLQGIDRASKQKVPKIPGSKRALLWLDLTPMPLQGGENLGLAKGEKHLCGLEDENVPAVPLGRQVPLEQILSSPLVNIELQYVGQLFIDYNLHAYGDDGSLLWASTWQECYKGGERRNSNGDIVVVHCRDVCSGTKQAPALRTLHIDLSRLEKEVFALAISSQCYTGLKPTTASVCLRELPEAEHSDLLGGTYREAFDKLVGGHDPQGASGALRGKPRLGASLTAALRASQRKDKKKKGKGKGKGKFNSTAESEASASGSDEDEGKSKGEGKGGELGEDDSDDDEGEGASNDSGSCDSYDENGNKKTKGGTCTYAVLYRDYKQGGEKWLFRNIMDECLQSTTFVAVEINDLVSRICREAINAEAVLTVKDPNLTAQLRACQLSQAFVSGGGSARCLVTGVEWGSARPTAKCVDIKGAILEDISALQAAQSTFMDRSLAPDACLKSLTSEFTAGSFTPDVFVRIGNVPELPLQSMPPTLAGAAVYALDMQGHLSCRPELLLPGEGDGARVRWIPGGGESCVNMLRTLLLDQGSLMSFVHRFGPPAPAPPDASSSKRKGETSETAAIQRKALVAEAVDRKAAASHARDLAKAEQDRLDDEVQTCWQKWGAEWRVIEKLEDTLDAVRLVGKQDWERERSGDIPELKRKVAAREMRMSELAATASHAAEQREVASKALLDASRDWRMQEDLLRSLEEESEVTRIRRSLRCKSTGKTVMETTLGVGLRVQIRVGYDNKAMERYLKAHGVRDAFEDEGESSENEEEEKEGETSNIDANNDERLARFMGAVCRNEFFSIDAFNTGVSKWSDGMPFEHFLPLALEGSDVQYLQAVRRCLSEIKLAMDQAMQKWRSEFRRLETLWASLEKSAAEDTDGGKGKGKKGAGKGKDKGKGKDLRSDAKKSLTATNHYALRAADLVLSNKEVGIDDDTLATVAVQVFPAVLNSVLVDYLKSPSDADLQLFCALQTSFATLVRACPALKSLVTSQVGAFSASQEGRSREKVKDVGQFLQLALVAPEVLGPEFWTATVEEMLTRQAVAYMTALPNDEEGEAFGFKGKGKGRKEKSPYISRIVQEFGNLVLDEDAYLKCKWDLGSVGCRLALFAQLFGSEMNPSSATVYYGRLLSSKRRNLEESLSGVNGWSELAANLQGFPAGPIRQILQSFVERAREQGYVPDKYYAIFEKATSGADVLFNQHGDEVQITSMGEVRGHQHAHLNVQGGTYSFMNFSNYIKSNIFHVKVVDLAVGGQLLIGWSCAVGDEAWQDACSQRGERKRFGFPLKGKGKEGKKGDDLQKSLALVMDLDSKSGMSARYCASGAMRYGNVDKDGSSFGPGDVVTCKLTVDSDTLTASFALNGKPLSASRRWQIKDLVEIAGQLERKDSGGTDFRYRNSAVAFIPTVSGSNFKVRLLSSTCIGTRPAATTVNEQRVVAGFSDEDLIKELSASLEGELSAAKLSFLQRACRACQSEDAARRAKLVELGLPMLLAQRLQEMPQGGAANTEARKSTLSGLLALAGKERAAREALSTSAEFPETVVGIVRSGTSEERQLGALAIEALVQDNGKLQDALLAAGCMAALAAVIQQADVTAEFESGAACKAVAALMRGDAGAIACAAALEAGVIVPVLRVLRKGQAKASFHAILAIQQFFVHNRKELEDNDVLQSLIEFNNHGYQYNADLRCLFPIWLQLITDMVAGNSAQIKKAGAKFVPVLLDVVRHSLGRGQIYARDKKSTEQFKQVADAAYFALWRLLHDSNANQKLALEKNGVQALAAHMEENTLADRSACFVAKVLLLLAEHSDSEEDKECIEKLDLRELAGRLPDDAPLQAS